MFIVFAYQTYLWAWTQGLLRSWHFPSEIPWTFRRVAKITSFVGLLSFFNAIAFGQNLKYDYNRPVELVGIIIRENALPVISGGTDTKGRKILVLKLAKPIDVEHPENDEKNISRLHIVSLWKKEPPKSVREEFMRTLTRYIEQHTRVKVEGTLFPAMSAHHKYPLVDIEKLSEVKGK